MRLAVDTNVLARALALDGSPQSMTAHRCLAENEIFVSNSVLLETEWVWRSRLKLDAAAIADLLAALVSTVGVHFENRERLLKVVGAHADGLDFADAMHLYAAADCEALVTFDRALVRRSRRLPDAVAVRHP